MNVRPTEDHDPLASATQMSRSKFGLTATTDVAPFELIKFLTSVRIAEAVALCASLNPLWTRTSPETPGNRVGLGFTWLTFKSLRTDKLDNSWCTVNFLVSNHLITIGRTIELDLFLGEKRSQISVVANTRRKLESRR